MYINGICPCIKMESGMYKYDNITKYLIGKIK